MNHQILSEQQINVSAPILSDSAGKNASAAVKSVVRILCPKNDIAGTGFFSSGGHILTAAHVVAGCQKDDLIVILSTGDRVKVTECLSDSKRDIAVLKIAGDSQVPPLFISRANADTLAYGAQVSVWGFPVGYNGSAPLLTVGYISGTDRVKNTEGLSPLRLVINAAFNGGNSGGPVINVEDGTVIGIVSSKLAPISQFIESALEALKNQKSGVIFTAKQEGGQEMTLTEGQVVGAVLTYLRSQTQLVVGHAVMAQDVHDFLKEQKIEN